MTLAAKKFGQLLMIILAIVTLDSITKYLVHTHVPETLWVLPMYPYGGIPVLQDFFGIDVVISHVTNRGGPWGVVASHHTSLLFLRIFAITCLWVHLLFFNQVKFREIPLAMVIAGAVGNVIDSFFYGHVIDMIHCVFWGYSFPVFNIADIAISCGVVMMLLHACVQKWKTAHQLRASAPPAAVAPMEPMFSSAPFPHEEPFSLDKIDHHHGP